MNNTEISKAPFKGLPQLISVLSQDLKNPSETKSWSVLFWFSWSCWLILMGVATWYTAFRWPQRSHLPSDLSDPLFWGEAGFWAVAAISAARIAYQSSFPIWNPNKGQTFSVALIAALLSYTLLKTGAPSSSFLSELKTEDGDCGIFILLFGSISTAWMIFVMRRAAPTQLMRAGAWCAASAGCVGAALMHLVCPHESPLHLFMWHFTPIVILIGLGSFSARKILRW